MRNFERPNAEPQRLTVWPFEFHQGLGFGWEPTKECNKNTLQVVWMQKYGMCMSPKKWPGKARCKWFRAQRWRSSDFDAAILLECFEPHKIPFVGASSSAAVLYEGIGAGRGKDILWQDHVELMITGGSRADWWFTTKVDIEQKYIIGTLEHLLLSLLLEHIGTTLWADSPAPNRLNHTKSTSAAREALSLDLCLGYKHPLHRISTAILKIMKQDMINSDNYSNYRYIPCSRKPQTVSSEKRRVVCRLKSTSPSQHKGHG